MQGADTPEERECSYTLPSGIISGESKNEIM